MNPAYRNLNFRKENQCFWFWNALARPWARALDPVELTKSYVQVAKSYVQVAKSYVQLAKSYGQVAKSYVQVAKFSSSVFL